MASSKLFVEVALISETLATDMRHPFSGNNPSWHTERRARRGSDLAAHQSCADLFGKMTRDQKREWLNRPRWGVVLVSAHFHRLPRRTEFPRQLDVVVPLNRQTAAP